MNIMSTVAINEQTKPSLKKLERISADYFEQALKKIGIEGTWINKKNGIARTFQFEVGGDTINVDFNVKDIVVSIGCCKMHFSPYKNVHKNILGECKWIEFVEQPGTNQSKVIPILF